jgi:hypothetical protein
LLAQFDSALAVVRFSNIVDVGIGEHLQHAFADCRESSTTRTRILPWLTDPVYEDAAETTSGRIHRALMM